MFNLIDATFPPSVKRLVLKCKDFAPSADWNFLTLLVHGNESLERIDIFAEGGKNIEIPEDLQDIVQIHNLQSSDVEPPKPYILVNNEIGDELEKLVARGIAPAKNAYWRKRSCE